MKNVCCVITKESSTLKAEISIHMEIVLQSLLLSSIVGVLKKAFDEVATEILEQLLPQIDDMLLQTKERCTETCKFVHRSLKTIFGWIYFRYRQAKKNGKHFRPLLDALGIRKGQRLTDDLLELAKLSTLYAFYRKSLRIAGQGCSLGSLWYAVQREGKMYSRMRDQVVYYYLEGEPTVEASEKDFAVILIDEIWIRHKKRRAHIRVKVARLGVVRYRGGAYVCEPLRICATAKGDQNSFAKKAKEFFDTTSGLNQISRIIVVSDGCDMGKELCKLYPGKAVWQLDWWHLWGYVRKGCKFEKDLEREIWELLNVEKIEEALGILRVYRGAMKCMEVQLRSEGQKLLAEHSGLVKSDVFWSSHQLEHLEKLITYISKNREGIYGVKTFAKDIPAEYLPFGSGPVERLQAVMIAYRMKKQGKHWSVEGADNLIQLLSREWNGEELDNILEEGIRGLKEWEEFSGLDNMIEEEAHRRQSKKKIKKRFDLSPNPAECVPILKRGRTDSFFISLKGISELKRIPHVVDFREEECPAA